MKTTKKIPKVGQKIYEYGGKKGPIEHTVTKVGRKYFYTNDGYRESKVLIENWHMLDWQGQYEVFDSPQGIIDKNESDIIIKRLKNLFGWGNRIITIKLSDLRKIEEIIDSNK